MPESKEVVAAILATAVYADYVRALPPKEPQAGHPLGRVDIAVQAYRAVLEKLAER